MSRYGVGFHPLLEQWVVMDTQTDSVLRLGKDGFFDTKEAAVAAFEAEVKRQRLAEDTAHAR